MSISLRKGQKIDLTKREDGSLSRVLVGLGWDEAEKSGGAQIFPIDCDAAVILCGADGKLISRKSSECCIYYGNLSHSSGAIIHQGDNLTGEGEGDDEQILVNLAKVPENIYKMVFAVNIYDARTRGQHFGMLRNAFIRLVDMGSNKEICRFDLAENYDNMTGLIVGEIYRKNGMWRFNAVGQPVKEASRLDPLLRMYL